jgi:phosphoribosylformylglycinamidine synthase
LLAAADIASKRPVFRQYDHSVQVRTVLGPGVGGAAVLRVHELAPRGVALTIAGSGRLCDLDPYRGARLAVAECAAGLACVGAEPLGITDCLNFGNPERPEVFWTFRQAVAGITDACRSLRIPVVGGNVSFYNESPDGPIPPTPVVAMVGLVEDVRRACGMAFPDAGHLLILVGGSRPALEGSAYLHVVHGLTAGRPGDVDFDVHRRVLSFVRDAVRGGLAASAQDCSDGGAAVALAESAIAGRIGAEATVPSGAARDEALFGEGPSRFIVSVPQNQAAAFMMLGEERDVPLAVIGRTGGTSLQIRVSPPGGHAGSPPHWDIDLPLQDLARAHDAQAEVFA